MAESKPDETLKFAGYGICEMVCIQPERNPRRFYRLEVAPGLFGPVVIRSWGRIGCRVRVKVYYHEDLQSALNDANRMYRAKLRRCYEEVSGSLVQGKVPKRPTQIQNFTIARRTNIPVDVPFFLVSD